MSVPAVRERRAVRAPSPGACDHPVQQACTLQQLVGGVRVALALHGGRRRQGEPNLRDAARARGHRARRHAGTGGAPPPTPPGPPCSCHARARARLVALSRAATPPARAAA
eukprot:4268592-Prymnesium_polylepis.1